MFSDTCIHAEDVVLDTMFDLTNKGIVTAKMKIVLSLIPGSGDNIEEFMKRVDDDSHMSSLPSSLLTLGQILMSTKAIMDRVPQVVYLSSSDLIIVG